jgi:NAD+ synthase (glutamine-hydrolysing)
MKIKIALAQIKTITGDLEGNTNRIIRDIERAKSEGVDMVVFPETAISSYACGDMFLHSGFVRYQLDFLEKKIAPITEGSNITVVVGFVDKNGREKDGFPQLFNSCAVIKGGKIETYDKILLAKRGQHEDVRYFDPGHSVKVFDLKVGEQTIKWSPVICQDIWNDENMRDVVNECANNGAKLIVSINQSYFYFQKQNKRKKIVGDHCVNNNVSMVYLNSFGVGDICKNVIIYNGQSFVINSNGDVIEECKAFEEEFKIVELNVDEPNKDNVVQKREEYVKKKITKDEKYEEIFNSLKFCVREFFDVSGLEKPIVYLSGGIDSSVVACIVAEAFDKEKTVFVSSPTEDNGEITKNNAQKLADALGVKLYWNSMQNAYEGYIQDYIECFKEKPSNRSKGAYQAIGRTAQSIALSHRFGKAAVVGCSNATENILGFSSFHDIGNSSAIGLINDLTKIEVFELAEYINKKFGREIIPSGLYNGLVEPSAELSDNKGADPYNYYLYSPICSSLIRFQMEPQEIIDSFKNKTLNLYEYVNWRNGKTIYENVSLEEFEKAVWNCFELSKRSVFKSAQSGPTPIISPFSRGFSSRETILNKFEGKYIIEKPTKMIELETKKLTYKFSGSV